MKNNENMGRTKFFKTGYKKVEYCKNKTIIKYRSSWELRSIEFLEINKIYYEYESFYIPRIDGKVYLPDFLIEIDKQLILLEIKGFIRGISGKHNEKIKIDSAKKFCEQNNMQYVYLPAPLSNIKQLIN
jgi:restriction endonuclease